MFGVPPELMMGGPMAPLEPPPVQQEPAYQTVGGVPESGHDMALDMLGDAGATEDEMTSFSLIGHQMDEGRPISEGDEQLYSDLMQSYLAQNRGM